MSDMRDQLDELQISIGQLRDASFLQKAELAEECITQAVGLMGSIITELEDMQYGQG